MAKFKNLEMSSTLSTNPDITVSNGFLGFGAKAIYTPTNTPLKAIINYYNAEDGGKLVKLLQMPEEQIAEKAEKMRMPQKPGSVENHWGNNLLFILIIPNFALWKKKCYAPWQLLFCLLKY